MAQAYLSRRELLRRETYKHEERDTIVKGTQGYICMAVFEPDQTLLARQIASFQAQTVTNWICLVGIDGEDSSARLAVEALCSADPRFIVREYAENVGFYRNFERILEEVPGSAAWIALSDQDDEWFPNKLEKLTSLLGDASLSFGQVQLVTDDGSDAGGVTNRQSVGLVAEFVDNQVTGSAAVFRRDLLDLALPFPAPTDLAFHDHWLGVCALVSSGISVYDEALQYYVQHDNNVIGEERRSSPIRRLARVREKASSRAMGPWRYMQVHRWGWRVSMASQVLSSSAVLAPNDQAFVEGVATGKISWGVLAAVCGAVRSRQAPPARAIGVLLGALHPAKLEST